MPGLCYTKADCIGALFSIAYHVLFALWRCCSALYIGNISGKLDICC
jgi:hypothetical protein